ncbi:MAG: PspC domain-containing protein [Lysobacterales bacterium]|nr:PspC domain-containing protein [Xanthomonadales bacterium]MCB1612300.1 PspC domain-containing protein [Xanthomonadales bacterium]MCP5474052.1 PspC domain-containing protein [Rhodanobacteraceae bacterium]
MNERFSHASRVYRDVDRRWFAGVLAGFASHFGWNLTALRIVTIIACMTPMVPLVFVGYVLAALILPPRSSLPPPPPPAADRDARQWQDAPPPGVSAGELKYRLREMEDRLRAMEAYVTSAQYEIDRELRDKRQ